MNSAWVDLAKGLIEGIPKIFQAIKRGRDLSTITLGEVVSEDALKKVQEANARADDFEANG